MTAIRNKHTHRLIVRGRRGRPKVAKPGRRLDRARWVLQEAEDGYVRLADAEDPKARLAIKRGSVVCARRPDRSKKAMWKPVAAGDGFVRLQNRKRPNRFLHTESGKLQAGRIKDNWWSAQWSLDQAVPTAARSVHLSYPHSGSKAFTVTASARQSVPGTFVMAVGFTGGYFGMQEISSPEERTLIFSVWDQPRVEPGQQAPDERAEVDLEHRAAVVQLGEGVTTRDFGSEGTGQHTSRPFAWSVGQEVRFLVLAKPVGQATHYSAFYDTGSGWTLMATLSRPGTGGRLIDDPHSFIEDFRRNGANEGIRAEDRTPYQEHEAEFTDVWACSPQGEWTAAREGLFTASDQKPTKMTNINATVEDGGVTDIAFALATGGLTVQDTALQSTIRSAGTRSEPPTLPDGS